MTEEMFRILTISVGIGSMSVGIGSIIANIVISKLNAGKNREIYGVETIFIGVIEPEAGNKQLNEKLSSGNYSVIGVFKEPLVNVFVIGKIRK